MQVVLALTWVFLKQRPSLWATIGSVFILGGTALSALPHTEADSDSLWYATNHINIGGGLFKTCHPNANMIRFSYYSIEKFNYTNLSGTS